MDHRGHGLALDHPIFNTPHKATFEWEEAPRESQYEGYTSPLYPEGMGDTYRLTKFEIDQPEGEWNPIIVSHEGFFTDIPGLENLSEGYSAKMLGSLSLVRQGRYFYWGYSIDPERSTAMAKDVLVNTIHYMKGFRDCPTYEYACKTRRTLWVYWDLNRRIGYLRGIEEHMPNTLTEASKKDYVPTPEGCKEWLDEYLPYVFSGKEDHHRGTRYATIFEVDFDAHALSTPNSDRDSLETWMKLASEKGEESELAKRCLARYVHTSIAPKDGDWKSWYAEFRDRIVFVESSGFWWVERLEFERK